MKESPHHSVRRDQAVAYRLRTHRLDARLPAGSYELAARFALQDSAPRSALLSLHARVDGCEPDAWAHPRLIQTYSPRWAVHILPVADFGLFTRGRLPIDPDEQSAVETAADRICRTLDGREVRPSRMPGGSLPALRMACASGRIALRWTTSALYAREVPRPELDLAAARTELCRRHVHAFGPTTPTAFGWWAGLSAPDARRIWQQLAPELVPVSVDGHRAWILAADESTLRSVAPVHGVRLLPAEELRLFGCDRTGMFIAPRSVDPGPLFDTFYTHGVLADGALIGSWARSGGKVRVRLGTAPPEALRAAIEAEALSFPIPKAKLSVTIEWGQP